MAQPDDEDASSQASTLTGNSPLVPSSPSDAPPPVQPPLPEVDPRPEAYPEYDYQRGAPAPAPGQPETVLTRLPSKRSLIAPQPPRHYEGEIATPIPPTEEAVRREQRQQAAMDRFNAQQMWEQHIAITQNPVTGRIEPATDETGRVLYRPEKGPVTYDATGHAVQSGYGVYGPQRTELDKDAPVGPHPDRPNELYKQNKYSAWDYLGSVQDNLTHPDPDIRKAAEQTAIKNDQDLHASATDSLGREIQRAAGNLRVQQAQADQGQDVYQNLLKEQTDLESESKKTQGGIFGIGAQLTDSARAASQRLETVNAQVDALSKQGYGQPDPKNPGDFKDPKPVADAKDYFRQLRADHAAWKEAKPDSVGDLDQMIADRTQSLVAANQDPASDPILASIEQRKAEIGIPTEQQQQTVPAQAGPQPPAEVQGVAGPTPLRKQSFLGAPMFDEDFYRNIAAQTNLSVSNPPAAASAIKEQISSAPDRPIHDIVQSVKGFFYPLFGPNEKQQQELYNSIIKDRIEEKGLVPSLSEYLSEAGSIPNFVREIALVSQGKEVTPESLAEYKDSERSAVGLGASKGDSKAWSTTKGVANGLLNAAEAIANPAFLQFPSGRAVSGFFAYQMLSQLPDAIGRIRSAPTLQGKVEASLDAAVDLLAGGYASKHAIDASAVGNASRTAFNATTPETAELVRDAIKTAKKNGVSPEFRSFFQGIDPELFGTTPAKVIAFAKGLGISEDAEQLAFLRKPTQEPPTTTNEINQNGTARSVGQPINHRQVNEETPTPRVGGVQTVSPATGFAPSTVGRNRGNEGVPTEQEVHAEINNLAMEGKSPEEHVATQTALRAMVKIGQGQPIESLTTEEKRSVLQKGPDGLPRVEMVKGTPVITNGALDRVGAVAPVTRQLLPPDEESQRQTILSTPKVGAEGQVQKPVSGQVQTTPQAPETLPTFSVEVQNAKGETREVQVQAADEQAAHAQVAQNIPPGQGLIRDVAKIYEPPKAAEPQKDFVSSVVDSARTDKGEELTPQEEKAASTVARVIQPHYERWQNAFSAVNATLKPKETGGVAFTGNRQLAISIPDVIRHAQFYKDTAQHAANLILHEAAHSVTTAAAPEQIIKLWKEAPQSLHSAMKKFYKAADSDYALAHEYWSYFLAGQAELASGRRIRLAGKFLPEQSSRKFVVENRKAIARVLRFVRNSESELRRAGKSPEFIRQWKELENLFTAKMKEVDGHDRPESKEITPHEEPAKAVVPTEHGARGPPAVAKGEGHEQARTKSEAIRPVADRGTGDITQIPARAAAPVTGAQLGERAPTPEPSRTPETAQLGQLTGEDRAALATSLRIPETTIGSTSRVTQNGRTLNVAYVAQEAVQARTSHDIQGRTTTGYDQSLQPRDRSLAQYRKQSQNIANNLDFAQAAFFPETKTPATTPDLGAPIMTKQGDTVIGNGREIGIKAAYDQGLASAQRYKTHFIRNARAFGIDPATVRDMRQPILKRVITDDVPKDELVRFSQESNEPVAMGANTIEVAGRDASRLTPQLLSLFDPNYAIEAAKNQEFVQAYLRDIVRGTTANEANLTSQELARRIRAAVFTYAYGADETGRAALERLAGAEGAEGKTITNGLLTVAPLMARLRADVASGDLHAGMDISTSLTRAAQDIAKAISDKPQNQSTKAAVESLIGQGELFPGSQTDYEALRFLVNNRNKRTAIEEGLSNYVEAVYRLGSPKEGELFAGREIPTPLDLFVRSTEPDAIEKKEARHELAAQRLDHYLQQTFKSRDDAFDSAKRSKPAFDRELNEVARLTGTEAVSATIKSVERAGAKVQTEYNGDWSRIKDLVRGSIVARDLAQAQRVVDTLRQRFGIDPKRDINQPLSTGYADATFNPVIDGHATEIQVQLRPLVHAKDAAHKFYERQQVIERTAKTENRALNAQELRLHDRLVSTQSRIYAEAWTLGNIQAGISSTASEGLQGRALATSAGEAGRGLSPSKAQAVPPLSTTIAKEPLGPSASRKEVAPGKAATASSSVIPLPYTPDEQRRAMEILRTQPISNDGEKIDKVAIRMPNGEVFTGSNHWDAADTVPRDQWRESRGNFEEGFLTNRGRFLDREEAFNLAKNYIRTPIESPIEGELETLTFRDAVKTQAALDEMDRAIAQLSSQQLNLFDDYAATLPAPAKVSKAALAERVGKEVPKIPDSKQAIDDLMSLAQHERRPPAVGLTHRVLGTVSPQVPAVEVAPAPEVQRELPEGKQVTISARTVDGAEVKIEMDAKKAERLLMKRESAFKALSDCLEAA